MSDCCFGSPIYSGRQAGPPAEKRVDGEITYIPVADKILTAKEYQEKLRCNRLRSGKII